MPPKFKLVAATAIQPQRPETEASDVPTTVKMQTHISQDIARLEIARDNIRVSLDTALLTAGEPHRTGDNAHSAEWFASQSQLHGKMPTKHAARPGAAKLLSNEPVVRD